MQSVYNDSTNTNIYLDKFDISRKIDVKLDCGETINPLDNSTFEEEL